MSIAKDKYYSKKLYYGFLTDLEAAIAQIKSDLEGKGELDRLSTWPVL